MKKYIKRNLEAELSEYLEIFPVTAILGPRQCGKSTLARQLLMAYPDSIFLDLEDDRDLQKLNDPFLFFKLNKDKLVCIDEIQRRPELFPMLRTIVDKADRGGQLLILGSASRELIKQSSESLAGRIGYLELTPFNFTEPTNCDISTLWLNGGFPRSILVKSHRTSYLWRSNFIQTYLERDLPQLGYNIPAKTLKRLWVMLAHLNGQVLNSSQLGKSLGISHTTLRKYVDILCQTYMVRLIQPYIVNTKKRLIKSPKIFIRDSGILHTLLGIKSQNDLLGHPNYGYSWKSFIVEQISSTLNDWKINFYRTAEGSEMDLVLTNGIKKICVEIKAATSPKVTRGFWNAVDTIDPDITYIIAPIEGAYYYKENVIVSSLDHFIANMTNNENTEYTEEYRI